MKYELRTTILALVPSILALAVAACSSDDSTKPKTPTTTTTTTGTTGSTSSGTTSTGTGSGTTTSGSGTTTAGAGSTTTTSTTAGAGGAPTTTTAAGSGGSATGTGGAGGAGTGGAGGAGGATGACLAPTAATGLISDFTAGNVANQLTGGTDTWFSPGTAMAAGGVIHFTAPATMFGNAVSALVASRPGMIGCADLTGKYTSISFKISSPTNTSMLFEIASKEVVMAMDGSGYRAPFTVTPTLTTVTIQLSSLVAPPFASVGATQASMPGFNILQDAGAILIVEPGMNMGLDIMLDDVTFQ